MGKSSSGKDTIYRKLLEDNKLHLQKIITYTTRPMRKNEEEGKQYFFTNQDELNAFEKKGKVIEKRVYHTVLGDWFYYTVDDGQVKNDGNYIIITTLEQYKNIKSFLPNDKVIPIYVNVDDGERLTRALRREKAQEKPQYEEMCRRFLADSEDFSTENLKKAGIKHIFENKVLKETVIEISEYIRTYESKE